jgi:hypothetical protein
VNKNRLLIALVVLAVLGGALASALRSRQSDTVVEKPKATLPELKRDEINKVELENPEKSLILTLAKQDGKWAISAPFAAKADSAAVDALLDKLSGLEVVRVAATHKAYVADKPVLDAYVGKANGSGTTLRKEGEEQVLAVRGSIRYAFDKDLKSFRDRTITDADPATITGITLSSAKGSFKFEKPEAGWQQVKGEKPIKDFAASKVESRAHDADCQAGVDAQGGRTGDHRVGCATRRQERLLRALESERRDLPRLQVHGRSTRGGRHRLQRAAQEAG